MASKTKLPDILEMDVGGNAGTWDKGWMVGAGIMEGLPNVSVLFCQKYFIFMKFVTLAEATFVMQILGGPYCIRLE